jgi:hypothetical protein
LYLSFNSSYDTGILSYDQKYINYAYIYIYIYMKEDQPFCIGHHILLVEYWLLYLPHPLIVTPVNLCFLGDLQDVLVLISFGIKKHICKQNYNKEKVIGTWVKDTALWPYMCKQWRKFEP